MSRDTSLGQHLIVGLAGTSLLPEERTLIKELRPLGIVLFAKNIDSQRETWTETLKKLIGDCRELAKREDFLVSIDHEGGRVHRFPLPVTRFPAAKHWNQDSFSVAQAMGKEIKSLGFNLSFAPVLDIHSEPTNTVIGDRAHSTSGEEVAKYALEVQKGLHSAGVLSCGKHFPGHGNTLQDSHLELPTLDISKQELRDRDLKPFVEFIRLGAPLLMSAHVRYTAIDPKNPASMSKIILSDFLRVELGYQNALITDDLEMRALEHLTAGQKAVMAISASTDILLEANPSQGLALEYAKEMVRALEENASELETQILASQERIRRLLDFRKTLPQQSLPSSEALGMQAHLSLNEKIRAQLSEKG